MTKRMKKYLNAARNNYIRNVRFDGTWAALKELLTRPIFRLLTLIYNTLGWVLNYFQWCRCEACNDSGYLFMWPLEEGLDSDPFCECAIGNAVRDIVEYRKSKEE
jgi:hypothetical protein